MKNGLAVFAMGLTCGVMSGWGAGCSNHGPYAHLGAAAQAQNAGTHQAAPSISPTAASQFSGSWICDDSQCESDEVKTVSDKLDSITTQSTVHFPKAKPESVCRVQQSQQLDLSAQSGTQASGSLQSPQFMVLDSAENTHDCQDYYARTNQAQTAAQAVSLSVAANGSAGKTPELSINGIHYRRASPQDLQSLAATREAEDSRDVSIAGTWNCVDEACNDVLVTIPADLSSMSTYQTLVVSAQKQSCRIVETSKLDITDSSDPDRLEGSLAGGDPSLVVAADNTDGCDDLVKNMDRDPSQQDTVTFERDGNQTLLVNGQRFLRQDGGNSS